MSVGYCIPPLLSLIGFAWLAVFTARFGAAFPGRNIFLGICILGCFLYIDVLLIFSVPSERIALWVSRIDHIFILYLIPLYLQFFSRYLGIKRYRNVVRIIYGVSFLLMLSAPTDWLIRGMQRHDFGYWAVGGELYWLVGLCAASSNAIVFLMLIQAIRNEGRALYRIKLIYMGIGFAVLGLLIGLNILPILGLSIYPPGNFAFLPLAIFAFGLFRYDLLGMNLLVRRGLLYGLTSLVLSAAYATTLWVVHLLFPASNNIWMLLITFAFFFGVGISIGPLQSWLRKRIDSLIGRDAGDYPAVILALSRDIVTIQESEVIVGLLVKTVYSAMNLTACAFYRGNDATGCFDPTVCMQKESVRRPEQAYCPQAILRQAFQNHPGVISAGIAKSRLGKKAEETLISDLEVLGASLIVPLVGRQTLYGLLMVSDKVSGEPFTAEDIKLLDILASQGALALENAASIEKVRALNLELEKKVEERTRSLQEALEKTKQMQEQMIRSESLASIGTLVAGTAHELNNPLASADSLVQSVLEELVDQPDTGSEIVSDLEFVRKQLGKAREIIRSLLGLSRQKPGNSEMVHLQDVVRDALKVLGNRLKHSTIRIETLLEPDAPPFRGSFSELGQLVLNLIDNAFQSVDPQSGVIRIQVSVDFEGKRIIFDCDDNGPGVYPNLRQSIFQPFFTTKAPGKGTGLGLYICHEIAARHGGEITVGDSPLGGARFRVTFSGMMNDAVRSPEIRISGFP